MGVVHTTSTIGSSKSNVLTKQISCTLANKEMATKQDARMPWRYYEKHSIISYDSIIPWFQVQVKRMWHPTILCSENCQKIAEWEIFGWPAYVQIDKKASSAKLADHTQLDAQLSIMISLSWIFSSSLLPSVSCTSNRCFSTNGNTHQEILKHHSYLT